MERFSLDFNRLQPLKFYARALPWQISNLTLAGAHGYVMLWLWAPDIRCCTLTVRVRSFVKFPLDAPLKHTTSKAPHFLLMLLIILNYFQTFFVLLRRNMLRNN